MYFTPSLINTSSRCNVGHRKLLPGNFWTFLPISSYARKQSLIGGSSDWVFWKWSCESKLLQTLIKFLKIRLKEIFCSKAVTLHCAKHNSFIVCLYRKCVRWNSLTWMRKTHFYILFENLFSQKLVSYTS